MSLLLCSGVTNTLMGPISAGKAQFLDRQSILSRAMVSGCYAIYPKYLSCPGHPALNWLIWSSRRFLRARLIARKLISLTPGCKLIVRFSRHCVNLMWDVLWYLMPEQLGFCFINNMLQIQSGGEGGIRTHGTGDRTPDFESGPFDHSGTSPCNLCSLTRRLAAPAHLI